MYERFFGLRERPFELTPDPRFLFLSPSHREALSNLQFGIAARKSLTVLIGEVGSGKTTLVRRTLTVAKEEGWRCIFLKNPQLSPDEFATFFARELGIDQSAELPRWERLEAIERRLGKLRTAGEAVGLIVDEAQNLSDALFEELRQLTNFETDTEKLLSVLLVGQPELGQRLNEAALRHLKQRIALRCVLQPLTLPETAAYIAARIVIAGGQSATVFTREAVTAIFHASRGLPRAVSVLCDNALITAFAASERPVSSRTVAEVCRDFDYASVLERPAAESDEPVGPISAKTVLADQRPDVDETAIPDADKKSSRDFGRRFSIFGATGR